MASRSNRKKGGKVMVASGNPNVIAEAKGAKDGAKTGLKKGGKVEGGSAKRRFDRPGRKRGGAVGANTSPLSTAHNVSKG